MIILGIETSCDETASAVIKNGKKILSSVVASSSDIHKQTGGVVPENAAREQIRSILPVIESSLKKAFNSSASSKNKPPIDYIAVTVGPGLIGSLLVGVETAKTLSIVWQKPLIAVNHLKGHIYANWLENDSPPKFPSLSLVVSGGHTDLVLMRSHTNILWVGGTRDDAAGEAFDKTARILSLPYPGGPEISKRAEKYIESNPKTRLELFPRPMIEKGNIEWSFSGLKTAVLNEVSSKKNLDIDRYAAEVQEAIVDVLVDKSIKAIKMYKPKSFTLSGGVSANKRLREKFRSETKKEKLEFDFFVPSPTLCTDNAAYIASRAFYTKRKVAWKKINANPELSLRN
jgi:N6-L-threonylcarbamoyladenine synthase